MSRGCMIVLLGLILLVLLAIAAILLFPVLLGLLALA